MNPRETSLQLGEWLGVADAGDDILALRVDQEVPVLALVPRRGVAGETHARTRTFVAVPEDHRLDVHRGSEVVGYAFAPAVSDGACAVPRPEHGFDRAAKLVVGILREWFSRVAPDYLLVGVGQIAEELRRDARVRGGTRELLRRIEKCVELFSGNVQDDPRVHRDEASVGVVCEALVASLLGEPFDRIVVEPEVEDRVHHAGHREFGSRANAHQQRVGRIADPLAHLVLEARSRLLELGVEAGRPAVLHVRAARVGGDREAMRYREPEHRRHLGQVGALATEEVLHLHRGSAVFVLEVEDVRHRGVSFAIFRRGSSRDYLPLSGPPEINRPPSRPPAPCRKARRAARRSARAPARSCPGRARSRHRPRASRSRP